MIRSTVFPFMLALSLSMAFWFVGGEASANEALARIPDCPSDPVACPPWLSVSECRDWKEDCEPWRPSHPWYPYINQG